MVKDWFDGDDPATTTTTTTTTPPGWRGSRRCSGLTGCMSRSTATPARTTSSATCWPRPAPGSTAAALTRGPAAERLDAPAQDAVPRADAEAAPHATTAAADRIAPHFVARVLAGSSAIADDGGRFLLSPAERHALVAAHLDGNRALVGRRGIADPGGFVDLPDPDAPWTPPAPITAAEVAAVWRECLAACFRSRRNPFAAARLAAQVARLIRPVARRIAREPAGAGRPSDRGGASVERPARLMRL